MKSCLYLVQFSLLNQQSFIIYLHYFCCLLPKLFMKLNQFQFNSDYQIQINQKSSKKYNIYLGGKKQNDCLNKSQKKGIILSKQFSNQKRLSNQKYLRQTHLKNHPYLDCKPQIIIPSLKPNLQRNIERLKNYNLFDSQRSHSCPLTLNNSKINQLSFMGTLNGNIKIFKKCSLPQKRKQILYFQNQQTSFHLINPQYNHNLSSLHFNGSRKFSKQNLNLHTLRPKQQPKSQIFWKCSIQKPYFSCHKIIKSPRAVFSSLKNTNNLSKNSQQIQSIYYQTKPLRSKEVQKINVSSSKNIQTIRSYSPSTSSTKNQKIELGISKVLKNLQENKKYLNFGSLTQSTSINGSNETLFSSNYYQDKANNDRNTNEKNQIKISEELKFGDRLKSLWDNVQTQSISLICQNDELPYGEVSKKVFESSSQKKYMQLGSGNNFNSWVIQKIPAQLNKESNIKNE